MRSQEDEHLLSDPRETSRVSPRRKPKQSPRASNSLASKLWCSPAKYTPRKAKKSYSRHSYLTVSTSQHVITQAGQKHKQKFFDSSDEEDESRTRLSSHSSHSRQSHDIANTVSSVPSKQPVSTILREKRKRNILDSSDEEQEEVEPKTKPHSKKVKSIPFNESSDESEARGHKPNVAPHASQSIQTDVSSTLKRTHKGGKKQRKSPLSQQSLKISQASGSQSQEQTSKEHTSTIPKISDAGEPIPKMSHKGNTKLSKKGRAPSLSQKYQKTSNSIQTVTKPLMAHSHMSGYQKNTSLLCLRLLRVPSH